MLPLAASKPSLALVDCDSGRRAASERQREHRERERTGTKLAKVPVPRHVQSWLIASGWTDKRELEAGRLADVVADYLDATAKSAGFFEDDTPETVTT